MLFPAGRVRTRIHPRAHAKGTSSRDEFFCSYSAKRLTFFLYLGLVKKGIPPFPPATALTDDAVVLLLETGDEGVVVGERLRHGPRGDGGTNATFPEGVQVRQRLARLRVQITRAESVEANQEHGGNARQVRGGGG